ncbi:Flavohemoprotein [Hondaea fermentalgiana]|uniref:nitric oxide dioxygenase n=1 Tax=Hondaea fermentalgiana TaxID=2315210 RepID=A0A2R5GMN0_9STRA|nr:Flavohemoprotein [Hondaea fermentalgiana]|eukprot:GBG29561.1 Flavohemoprotein [Hondaea fermentalgiana]
MALSRKTIDVVKATAPVVAEHAVEITSTFYPLMFKNNPEVLTFFNKGHQKEGRQPRALADAVVAFASHIEDLGAIKPAVDKIAARHVALSVKPEHYAIVHKNLMAAIGQVLGDAVTPEIGQAWSDAVLALAGICIDAEEALYKQAETRKGGWRYEREFEVSAKEKVAEDTVRFQFKPCDGGSKDGFEFTPGQYLTVRVPEVSAPRHYTLTSKPGAEYLEITTRLVSGGDMSNFMHKETKVGDKVLLGAPMGVYVPEPSGKPAVLVSAGIGETPMLAFLQSLPRSRIAGALHVDRSKARHAFDAIFQDAKLPFYKTVYSSEGAPDVSALAKELVEATGPDADYYVCGPNSFMADIEGALREQNVSSVISEVFGTGSVRTNTEAQQAMEEAGGAQ